MGGFRSITVARTPPPEQQATPYSTHQPDPEGVRRDRDLAMLD